jgi:hypothetical protein
MAPEPISKSLAIAMTLFLWGYLGTELWGLISATSRLWDETKNARTFHELRESSERYAQVLGPNTLRVLILLATWKAGARGKEAMTGSGLPRFPQAIQNAASAGRFRLPTAASEAEAVSVVEGRLVLTLPSGSAAVLAMQQQGDGEVGPGRSSSRAFSTRPACRWRTQPTRFAYRAIGVPIPRSTIRRSSND